MDKQLREHLFDFLSTEQRIVENPSTTLEFLSRLRSDLGPVCPACESGDHFNSYICGDDFKCICPCHFTRKGGRTHDPR